MEIFEYVIFEYVVFEYVIFEFVVFEYGYDDDGGGNGFKSMGNTRLKNVRNLLLLIIEGWVNFSR